MGKVQKQNGHTCMYWIVFVEWVLVVPDCLLQKDNIQNVLLDWYWYCDRTSY